MDRTRYIPISIALGLFVGDLVTLALRGEIAVGRLAASAVVSIVAYAFARWFIERRGPAG